MPNLRFDYQAIRSRETGLFIFRPRITVILKQLSDPGVGVFRGKFRVDTGADISAVPFELAADVLGLRGDPSRDKILSNLKSAMRQQDLNPVSLLTATGGRNNAYPLWVPLEIADDDGTVGDFEGLIAFVDGKKSGLLAGLCGFLDKFDVSFLTREFAFTLRAE